MKLFLSVVAEKDYAVMLSVVRGAFLYGDMRRNVYIELPRQGPRLGGARVVGELTKAMHCTRDAPQTGGDTMKKEMAGFGQHWSEQARHVFRARHVTVVAHVDCCLGVGAAKDLEWLFGEKTTHGLKNHMLGMGNGHEVKYLIRELRRGSGGYRVGARPSTCEGVGERVVHGGCRGKETPLTTEGQEMQPARPLASIHLARQARFVGGCQGTAPKNDQSDF